MIAPPPPAVGQENFNLVETLRSLASLADRLREEDREEDKDLPKERKL
jgi:hypothetical protein